VPEPVVTEHTLEVARCGEHQWRLEDRTPPGVTATSDFYLCDVCQKCRAIRCGGGGATDPNRCLEARHHRSPHRFPDGSQRDVGA
jgi:hypothetical protein